MTKRAPVRPPRREPQVCPVLLCKERPLGTQGLYAHVRAKHPKHLAKYGIEPAPEAALPLLPPLPLVVPAVEFVKEVVMDSPLALLDSAISSLQTRADEIDKEMKHLDALQKEAVEIGNRLAALAIAREAFEVPPATDAGN